MSIEFSSGDRLKLVLAGCGRISQVHLTCIARESRAELAGVVDVNAAAALGASEAWGAPSFATLDEALEKAKPDAVIICTPPNTHRELAEKAFAAGAHVLCEKPLALSEEDAASMMSAAEGARRVLMMASKFRYVSDIVKAKGIIQSGILGEVIFFENAFCSRVDMRNRWNSVAEISGGGVLSDNGCHSADIVRFLMGPVKKAQAEFGKPWQKLDVEDTAFLHLRCENDAIASIQLSWSIHRESPYYVHVFGTEGMLEIGWKGSRYRQSEKLDWIPFGDGYDKFQAVGAQLRNFIATTMGEDKPVITTDDAVHSVRLIRRAYDSAASGTWETLS